ncbi:MAG TPA: hypothetical protein VH253_08370 [Phycisphaerae bacterium]|nr:hypothetical protein [Phycisphaerae bacterium]
MAPSRAENPMLNTDSLRRLLAVADVAKDPYAVADVAATLLAANPSDPAAADYRRALAHLKLPSTDPPAGAGGGANSGAIPWSSRARRFAANLRALAARHPAAAELVQNAAAGLESFRLHGSADGNYQIAAPAAGPGDVANTRWLGGLADHKAATALWTFDKSKTPVPPPLLFDGLGFGWLFLHVFATTTDTYNGYAPALYVLESDPLAFAMLLHLHDLQTQLAHPRTRCFLAATPDQVLRQFTSALHDNPGWTLPQQSIRCHLRPRDPLPFEAPLEQLRNQRLAARDKAAAEIAAHYGRTSVANWSAVFTAAAVSNRPLRILAITSRYTTVLKHAVAELQSAAADLGHLCEIAIEPDDHSLEHPFLAHIAAFKPDLLLQISRLRYENPLLAKNVPFLCWDQDNLPCMRTDAATQSLDALTFVAGHAALHGWSRLDWPRRNVIFCHPAASTHRYPATPAPADLLQKHACDISFISNASVSPEEIAAQQAARWTTPPALADLFAACANEILTSAAAGKSWEFSDLQSLLTATAAARGFTIDEKSLNELALSLALIADRCFRHAALHWAANFADMHNKTFRLYGQGWDKHPRFSQYAAGPAAQGPEIHAIYQASKINLQLIEGGFLHSRSLDGLAAGAFFLTRASPNDSRGDQLSLALHTLATRALALGLATPGQLAASQDPALRAAHQILAPHLAPYPQDRPLRALENWAALPQPPVLFPQLAQIRFTTQAEFSALAARYLADAAAREKIAADMHAVVRHHFTHTHRLQQFLQHITTALAAGCSDHETPVHNIPASTRWVANSA